MSFLKRLFGGSTAAPSNVGQRTDIAKGFDSSMLSVVEGWRFCATIQLRTPLRILKRDREVSKGLAEPPEITRELWEGIWLPVPRALDVLPAFQGSTRSSDIGPIPSNGGDYLKFLLHIREIVEAPTSVESRRSKLRGVDLPPEWKSFSESHGGLSAICDYFFPPFTGSIKGLQAQTLRALEANGWKTPQVIASLSNAELLAVKGIGPSKIKAIRIACDQAHDSSSEFLDSVSR